MSQRSEKSHTESDLLDSLLADYFGWVDHGHCPDVDAFLEGSSDTISDPSLIAALRDYVDSTRSIEELAAFTTVGWIDPESIKESTGSGGPANSQGIQPCSLPAGFGAYELLAELGRGGMGIAYRARHKTLDRIVCLKMILLGRLAAPHEIERFRFEAQAMARLRHPNLVTVYEAGQVEDQDYFAMEYIAGPTLADRVREAPLTAPSAARYVQAVARAIHFAHENGVLHRDLKPSNILLDEFDQPRVTDFGLARLVDAGSLTRTGTILGTPSYIAPEQTHGESRAFDVRSDVYGLGAVLYELLTGRPPFQGETPLDTLLLVRRSDPVVPSLLNPRVPRDLETICLTCLDKDPAQRYSSGAALAEDLERFRKREPIRARPIRAPQRFYRWCCRNPLWSGLGATVVAALLVITGIAAFAYRTTASALFETEWARDEQAQLAEELRRERDIAQSHLYLSQIHQARQAAENGDLQKADQLLQRQAPTPGEVDRRGWEWFYLEGLLSQSERSLDAHTGPVHAVAWSPDGGRLASVGEDQVLRVFNASTDDEIHSLRHPGGIPLELAWDPSGDRFATAALDGILRIWNAADGTLLQELSGTADTPRCLSWSPRGNRLAAGGDGGDITVWTVTEGTVNRTLSGHDERVNAVRWATDGGWIASGSDDGTVRIWNTADGSCAAVVQSAGGWIHAVAWSSDNRRLAAVTQDGVLHVWKMIVDPATGNLRTDELYTRVTSQRKPWLSVLWSQDSRYLLTGGVAPRLMVWDAETGEALQTLRGHLGIVRRLAGQPKGERFASASADGTVKIWRLVAGRSGMPLARNPAPIRMVAWSADGRWTAWRDIDGRVAVWDADSHRRILTFDESPLGAAGLAWHPERSELALSRDSSVVVFSVPEGREVLRLEAHDGPVWTIAWDRTGRRIASGSNDRSVILWDSQTGRKLQVLEEHPGDVRCLAWSHDGTRLATVATEGTVRIWDAAAGKLQQTIASKTTSINDLAWSADDHGLAAAVHEGLILRWNLPSGRALPPLAGHHGAVWDLTWSRDGRRLFSCGQDGTVRLWDATTEQQVLQIAASDKAVWSISLSPDERRLFSCGLDQTIRSWEYASGNEPK